MITDEQAERYAVCDIKRPYSTGIIALLEEQYILPETRCPIVLEPWQKDQILMPVFYDLDENGRRKYNIMLIGLPKKNGKSAFGAGIGIYTIYAGEPYGEIIIGANAKDQASMIIYTKIRRSINMNPAFRQVTPPLKELIEVKSTGTICRCVAHQYETAAGLNPNLTIFDELWAFGDRRFYDELTVVPTRKDPLIVIVTYAGYLQRGLLWDLYSDGMNGEPVLDTGDPEVFAMRGRRDPRMFMFWSHKNLASWITPEYLESQRRRLPPDIYARLHENRWVAAGSQFITDDDINSMYETPWIIQTEARTDKAMRYIIANDVGLSHDRTARVVGHYDRDDKKVYIDNIRVWQGTPEQHVDIAEVERDLVDCAHQFKAVKLVVDPWQMEYTIQRLKSTYNVESFTASGDSMQHISQIFVNLLRSHRLISYLDPNFEEELRNTIIKQTLSGWRIDHPGKKRNDIVIAVAMMAAEAVKEEHGLIMEVPSADEFSAAPLGFKGVREKEF